MTLTTNPHYGKTEETVVVADAVTDGSGDTTVDVDALREIESVEDVDAHASGGYVAQPQSVSGNTVTVRIFESAGSAGALAAVTSSIDVTDVRVNARGR